MPSGVVCIKDYNMVPLHIFKRTNNYTDPDQRLVGKAHLLPHNLVGSMKLNGAEP